MSGKDMCVCKHALDKHDEDGVCKHDCDECERTAFVLDARVSPELTEEDVVALFESVEREFSLIQDQIRIENIIGKIAFQSFGRTLGELRSRGLQRANKQPAGR